MNGFLFQARLQPGTRAAYQFMKKEWRATEWSSVVGCGVMEGEKLIAAVPSGKVNADLIAAAPNLFDAVTLNLGGWQGPELLEAAADHSDDSAIADLLRERAKAERLAIKKARGEG